MRKKTPRKSHQSYLKKPLTRTIWQSTQAKIINELIYNPGNLTQKQIASKYRASQSFISKLTEKMKRQKIPVREKGKSKPIIPALIEAKIVRLLISPNTAKAIRKKALIINELIHNPKNLTQKQIAEKHGIGSRFLDKIVKELERLGMSPRKKARIIRELRLNPNLSYEEIAKTVGASIEYVSILAKQIKDIRIKVKKTTRGRPKGSVSKETITIDGITIIAKPGSTKAKIMKELIINPRQSQSGLARDFNVSRAYISSLNKEVTKAKNQ